MHQYHVYFTGFTEPLTVTALSFSEAEKTALQIEKFKTISRIELKK